MAKKEKLNEENIVVKDKTKKKSFKTGINSFFTDFKKFISKGNIIDLSIAVVIGAAFNKIVSSFVNNIIMPLISILTGGVSVADWKWVIKQATYDSAGTVITAETALNYGIFIQAIIDFFIIALTIFIVLKLIVNSKRNIKELKKRAKLGEDVTEVPAPEPVKIESQEDILKDIRELLQKQITPMLPAETEQIIDELTKK